MTPPSALFASALSALGDRRRLVAAAAAIGVVVAASACLWLVHEPPAEGPTIGERLSALEAERAALQVQADGEGRIGLVTALRAASLLSDALAIRLESSRHRALDRVPPSQRRAFGDVDALNTALREAVTRPSEGARVAARAAARQVQASLDRMAGDGVPLVLQFSPRFVPPRRAAGELMLAPQSPGAPPAETAVRLDGPKVSGRPEVPLVPRYAPGFATPAASDPLVRIEIAAVDFDRADAAPVLTVGSWRGTPNLAPLRMYFSVPRSAFATDAARTTLVTGVLSWRRGGLNETVKLLFVVLPDRPGSFAFDQQVRTLVPEANTLVSPEILARGEVGKTRTVRRCFDPPTGWRFDKNQRRVVTVERLGWVDDASDPTMNDGTVEFAADEGRDQICVVVMARPVAKEARTATIGRFEATLVHDTAQESVVKSGVRALDWNEPVRVPLEPGLTDGRLYLRLLGEIDREFDRLAEEAGAPAAGLPFVAVSRDGDGKTLILRADSTVEPKLDP
jgi:hypothetical protein